MDRKTAGVACEHLAHPLMRWLGAMSLGLHLHEQFVRGLIKIFVQGRAKPGLHLERWLIVPIPAHVAPPPFKADLATRKCRRREQHDESIFGTGNCSNSVIYQGVRAADEWLLYQSETRVIEHPHVEVFVWSYDIDRVHDARRRKLVRILRLPRCRQRRKGNVPWLCSVSFAHRITDSLTCRPRTQAAIIASIVNPSHSVRPSNGRLPHRLQTSQRPDRDSERDASADAHTAIWLVR